MWEVRGGQTAVTGTIHSHHALMHSSECAPCGCCARHAKELASGLGSGNSVQTEWIEMGQAQREAGQGRAPEGFERKGSPP